MAMILRNCRMVITQNPGRDVVENYDILIENGRIAKVAKTIDEDAEKIDCSGKLVMPALFNAHTHSSMSLLRGYNDDKDLHEWLGDVWKVEAMLTPQDMRAGALFSFMEMAKTGTFGFMDMYFEMEEVAKACHEIGLCGFLGYGMIDLQDQEKREREIARTVKFATWLQDRYDGIVPVLAPHAIYTCSKDLLVWAGDYASRNGMLSTIHMSETRKEVEDCIKERNMTPVHYLDSTGFLGENTVLFHSSFVDADEIRILAQRGAKVVHCPASNMKLGTGGVFPLGAYEDSGMFPMLGTDGACSNNSLDMFSEMKFAALLQKFATEKPSSATARQVLDMATVNPAGMLGTGSGSIEEGKRADIAILDIRNVALGPTRNILSNVVYSSAGGAVSDMIVNGKIILRNGMLETMDEDSIRDGFESAARRLY